MPRVIRYDGTALPAFPWSFNGDHPNDASEILIDGETNEAFYSEGKVVRRYRVPDVAGTTECGLCHIPMHFHGWLDTGDKDGVIVCPGSWIVEENGSYTAMSLKTLIDMYGHPLDSSEGFELIAY